MGTLGRLALAVAGAVSALALAGCAAGGLSTWWGGSSEPEPVAAQSALAPEIPATIRSSEVVGQWGYSSFHDPKERIRTTASARIQCSHPYQINPGPSGGVKMYPPDQSELVEYRLKGGQGGKNYIGPAGEPEKDQEILSFDGRVMLLRSVDPDVATRYGTGVYVRCAPPGRQRGATKKAEKSTD